MSNARLQIPSNPGSEIFLDSRRLVVSFRERKSSSHLSQDTQKKVLRIVIQAFGRMLDDRFFLPGAKITVGPGKRNTFRIPTQDLPKRHPLIKYALNGSITLSVNKYFGGVLQINEKLNSVSQTPATESGKLKTIQLPKGSKGCLEHGNLLIYFEEIPDPEKVPPVAIFKNLSDPYFLRWLLVSLSMHLFFLLILKLMPSEPTEVTLEELGPSFQKIIVQPQEFKPLEPQKFLATLPKKIMGSSPMGQEGEGAKAPGEEGRRGKGVPGVGKKMAGKDLQKTGVLDFFSKGKESSLRDLLGESAIPGSYDNALNRNRASRYGLPGEREIRERKGLQGSGTGGGGLQSSIGEGLGTKGLGGGKKGPGLSNWGTGKSDTLVSDVRLDEEEVYLIGNIAKSVIAKIINDHLGQIKYCYERQLNVRPDLKGKIVTTFVIGLEGKVTSVKIKQTTMNNADVEGCLSGVIRRMPFPKPGGGIVEVTYPFLFRVAG